MVHGTLPCYRSPGGFFDYSNLEYAPEQSGWGQISPFAYFEVVEFFDSAEAS